MIEVDYNFSDFTTAYYEQLLTEAIKKYPFCFYDEISNREKFILWRHDIDFSVNRALRLAEIENRLNLKSTFFIHLHSEYYNVLEKEISDKILKIVSLGHQIGLHFDTHYYNIEKENDLEEKLLLEKDILNKIFGIEVKVFSFHNTTDFTMACQKFTYAGIINTYASFFQNQVEYCSDSNGYWRYKRMIEVISNNDSGKLQILTHPEWWQEKVMSPWERITRAIEGRSEKNKSFYQAHLRRFGMKNIDWNGELK